MAMSITFKQARERGACTASYKRVAESLGGVRAYGANTPIPLAHVLSVRGIQDVFWCVSQMQLTSGQAQALRLFAADCAERVLPIFERERPNDLRP